MFTRHHGVWPKELPKTMTLPKTSVFTNLAVAALRYPDHPAIIFYDRVMTYRQLLEEVEALAGYLQEKGVRKGDRVLLYMQNSPQYVIGYYAILRADAAVIPVNPMNRAAELEHYISDTDARICLAGQELAGFIAPLVGSTHLEEVVVAAYNSYIDPDTDLSLPAEVAAPVPKLEVPGLVGWDEVIGAGYVPGPHTAGPDDIAVIPYSSGTTGAPKGCTHVHRGVMATACHRAFWNLSTADTVQLSTLPFFHVTGMTGSMNSPIYSGSTSVIMTRWDRTTAAKLIERYKVTGWTNIVTMAVDFLSNPELGNYDISSLKTIGGGGAAMPAAIAAKLKNLTGLDYIEGYGLSETMAATHINPPDAPKAQCLGIPVFDVDSRIIDVETLQEKGPGEVGEIVSNGPQVTVGYWNRPMETEAAFVEIDGKRFFRTGDLGYYDEDGYFFMVDRVKRMINASGFKVWPSEVESLMYRHPSIHECCVISAPDPKRGETVKACIVLTPESEGKTSAEEIIAWCKEEMSAYKVPQLVEFVAELPKSPTGKVMWRALQEQEWQDQASA
ncbi:long-chain fatty acid--CoA ligase [Marinobacter nanhaiticus D15-8W]|uniref:Long-chain fatty acid--CoA ligase n=1 Tax=Marinobacter nanhaiticus D15-8W TaxID=626887 RepID=N6X1D8_9GAMM|nr:long-chain fatty acid--CoA ligase [Marinobacter nanhaiticus]ENO14908.1 long-chain fatty acid--CoA ligase [Marinobacter nanhaiticus D15-8W]BES69396.1 long-chain fatty acid--CoA ligase [Marinobacter nanhaiticus D15-8W]